ncbi:RAVE subunit 2/Rogdi [Thelonectria olida]|uniref:RAVE subunit 2/Rogdi n=1 Tax=Thelonectria olida TaxID=1576542 RepID=A0A9P9AMR2_9HYPO|nr:RAVE subunit 2/Rogdi [Thelonectria olida]
MSIAVWPAVSPSDLRLKAAETQERELEWIVQETLEVCRDLKHGLDDCYALLAPIDPGSTLVVSTPRNEKVKGTLTRVGTRIVKGTLNLQLRTIPAQHLSLAPNDSIHIDALESLHTHLTQATDLLSITLSRPQDPRSLDSTLAILADSIADSLALLKGPPIDKPDPGWQGSSCPPHQFHPIAGTNLSIYINIQESSIVVWLRALEPVDAPVHFGTKLGLAIGTFRRLEHDEMDTIFRYNCRGSEAAGSRPRSARHTPEPRAAPPPFGENKDIQQVYVREKVRIESADPSLISLHSKLGFLSHMLGQTRRNLTAVMGVDSDD